MDSIGEGSVKLAESGENPLEDKEIGWHTGDWDYNTRSVGIVGHKEIEPGHTACPGEKFEEWKDELISLPKEAGLRTETQAPLASN